MLACLDLDAFFVAVERAKDPSLKGVPVIVGGDPDRRGVVSSASYEARARGVHSAMPAAQARRLVPEAVILPPDMAACSEFSRRVAALIARRAPLVEQASIDEWFFSFQGCERLYGGRFFDVGEGLRAEIEALGLSASIGFAASRPLAKIAATLAKPAGQLMVLPGCETRFLAALSVTLIPGVGPRLARRLRELGVTRVRDLQRVSLPLLRAALGRAGGYLHAVSRGEGGASIVPRHEAKGISAEETLSEDTSSRLLLESLLARLTERAIFRMRRKGLCASRVSVKIRYADFVTASRSVTLSHPVNDYVRLKGEARRLLGRLRTRRVRVRLLGVAFGGLTGERQEALGAERLRILAGTVDAIKTRWGPGAVSFGLPASRFPDAVSPTPTPTRSWREVS